MPWALSKMANLASHKATPRQRSSSSLKITSSRIRLPDWTTAFHQVWTTQLPKPKVRRWYHRPSPCPTTSQSFSKRLMVKLSSMVNQLRPGMLMGKAISTTPLQRGNCLWKWKSINLIVSRTDRRIRLISSLTPTSARPIRLASQPELIWLRVPSLGLVKPNCRWWASRSLTSLLRVAKLRSPLLSPWVFKLYCEGASIDLRRPWFGRFESLISSLSDQWMLSQVPQARISYRSSRLKMTLTFRLTRVLTQPHPSRFR